METLYKFKNFVDEITKDNSRLYKTAVLAKYKDDEDIKYYLHFLLSPYVKTGISDKKLYKLLDDQTKPVDIFTSVKDVLEYLKVRNTGRDIDISRVTNYKLFDLPDELWVLYDKIIIQDLPLGVDTKTINKAMGEAVIEEFNVQLAEKYFEDPDRIIGKQFSITTKIDGSRIIAIKENGDVKFYTRQGQLYEGLIDLEEEMRKYMPDDLVLDGELTLLDKGNLKSKDQYKQTMKISRADGEKHGLKMLVFDCMSVEEFKNQNCEETYKERRSLLDQIFLPCVTAHIDMNTGMQTKEEYYFKYFELLPVLYTGTDTSEISKWLGYKVAHGEEGIMLNITDAKYEFKRTWNLMKCKKMNDLDLKLIGFEEGTGRNKGRLGAILVDYNGYTVKVGSGFSDRLREEIWAHKEAWLGRIIIVKYFEETQNQQGGKSLRFPIYIDYRTDKFI